jgi:hypothetical protein
LWITGVFVPLATLTPRGCDPRTLATGLSSHSVTRGILRLLPPPGCPTGTVMPRGSRWLSAVESKRLEGAQCIFFAGLKACAWGKQCHAQRLKRACRIASCNRYVFLPKGRTIVSVCQT